MQIFELFGSILLKDNGVEKKLDNIDKKGIKVGSSFGGMAKAVGGFVLAGVSIAGTVAVIKDLTDATMAQQRAETRLETLMKNVKGTTDKQIESVKKYASELQGLTTIGDEVAISGASQLATFQLQADSIKKLMPSMNDLAVSVYGVNVSQEQMIQMGNLVGKAVTGQVGALTRYGVTLTKTQQELIKNGTEQERVAAVTEALQANFGGLAKSMAGTTEGAIQQMKNAWGDMKEVLGSVLLPKLGELAIWFSSQIPTIQTVLEAGMNKIGEVINFVSNNILPPLQNGFNKVSQESIPLLQKAFDFLTNTIVPALGKAFQWFMDNIFPTLIDYWTFVAQKLIPPVIEIFSFLAEEIVPMLAAKFQEWMPVIAEIVKGLAEVMKIVVSNIVTAFEFAWPYIKDIVTNAVNTLSGVIGGLLTMLKGIIDFVTGVFTGDWGKAWEGVKQIFTGVFDSIKAVLKGTINGIIAAMNFMIRGLNKLKFEVPDWVPGLGGKGFGLNIPEIPKLAKGGNILDDGAVMVGENGAEILSGLKGARVTPLAEDQKQLNPNNQTLITGNNFYIREETDIKKVARELFNLQQRGVYAT